MRTTYPNPHRLIASAVFSGSLASNGGGVLLVLTLQNRHCNQPQIPEKLLTPRVQVSPINIIVAVALDLSEPPQQSPIFGHLALSQTSH